MATMNISLPDALEAYIQTKLDSGGYTSASEIVREALRLLQEHDQEHLRLRTAVKEGLDTGEAGRVVSIDEVSGESIATRARRKRRGVNA